MKYLLLLIFVANISLYAQETPHPDSLTYPSFDWQIPLGDPYRTVLKDSIVAYIVHDTTLPIFEISLTLNRGDLQEPLDKPGLISLYTSTIIEGGTKNYTPEAFDKVLAQYALTLSVSSDQTTTSFYLSGLSKYYPIAESLMVELITSPQFNEERFNDNKTYYKEAILHQFDTPAPIRSVLWSKVIYPQTIFAQPLLASDIDAITLKDLRKYHKELTQKTTLSIGAAGDITKEQIEHLLTQAFRKRKRTTPTIPLITPNPQFTTVVVHKEGVNQAYIRMGFPSFKRPDTRYYPLTIYNEILGGGGFNSRLMSQVRSNAGLTYSISSTIGSSYFYKPTFSVSLFTKSSSVNHAIGLTQKIITETAQEQLSKSEIDEKKRSLIQSLPSMFRSAADIAFTYQSNELLHRSPTHYRDYAQRINEISPDSIMTVAQEYFKTPLITVVVGDTSEIFKSDSWEGYNLKDAVDTILTVDELVNFNN